MKINWLVEPFFLFFCWSNMNKSSANMLNDPIRISTRYFAPYMYQDHDGKFYDGIEFQFLQRMADMLNVSLHFQTTSNHSDICNDVAMNISDICIGGIFPTGDILKHLSMSTHMSDDLTWCVRKAKMMPMFLVFMLIMTPTTWFLIIFGYGYPSGFFLYLLIQFDLKYERRNKRDWHYTTWLVALPAALGVSPNFHPLNVSTRMFYGFVLISGFVGFQIVLTRYYEFLHKQISWHQVSTFNEIVDNDFDLIGSWETYHLLNRSNMILDHKIESFYICDDMNECLLQLLSHNQQIAIGGSRQNIENSLMYSPSQVFCFDGLENIAGYPVAFYMRKEFYLNEKVNAIVGQLFGAGYFAKWKRESQFKRKHEIPYTIPLQLPVSHVVAPLVFLIGCGSVLSTLTFVAENIVSSKMRRHRGVKPKMWKYLEQFFDGRRHYLKNLPERLQAQRNYLPHLE